MSDQTNQIPPVQPAPSGTTGAPGLPDPAPPKAEATSSGAVRASIFAEKAGYAVMVISAVAILAAFWTVNGHISLIEGKIPQSAYGMAELGCKDPAHCDQWLQQVGLESTAQILRSERVFTALSTRMSLFIFGEIVALVLCVAGGVLILNRIEAAVNEKGSLSWGALVLSSTFPGLIMCGLGTGIVALTLYASTNTEAQITVFDYPVFVRDENTQRNLWNVASGMVPGKATAEVWTASTTDADQRIDALKPSENAGEN